MGAIGSKILPAHQLRLCLGFDSVPTPHMGSTAYMSAAMGGGRRRQAGVLAERYMPESWAGNGRGLPQHDRPHASPRNALGAPSKTAWKAACACGRLSLKVGVIIEFSTEKGSGCRWIAATCQQRAQGRARAGRQP